MRAVAEAAGVSITTVGNVLNRPEIVSPTTRRRVEEAIAHVGFVRNGLAGQLRGRPSLIVGVVTLDLASPFYAAVNRGIEDRLAEAGCMMLTCSVDMRAERETWALRLLREHAVRGIIITPVTGELGPLTRLGTPVVLLDHPVDQADLCAVTTDNILGGQLAAEHLLGLGHRRLAFMDGPVPVRPVSDRLSGVRQALADAGLDPSAALRTTTLDLAGAVDEADAMVDSLFDRPDPPTAIICFNDMSSLGTLRALERRGLRVPGDVSVIGYDDLEFAARLRPALTTVRQPAYQLGRSAADLLLDEERPDHQHREVRFLPALMARSSTGPAPS
jgi:LacI family transcriptional regulator